MDITRLQCWPELQKLGFTKITFRAHGRIVSIGCALQETHTDLKGKSFCSDIICIEPSTNTYSDGRNYHITGKVKTPYLGKFYRYEFGHKLELFLMVENINDFYPANKIIETVHSMLK